MADQTPGMIKGPDGDLSAGFQAGPPRVGDSIDIPLKDGQTVELVVTKVVWRQAQDGQFQASIYVDAP